MPELLRSAGYRTACIGKWHLGWDWPLTGGGHVSDHYDGPHVPRSAAQEIEASIDWTQPIPGGPTSHGFDRYFGDDVPNQPPYVFFADDRVLQVPDARKPVDLRGVDGPAVRHWRVERVLPRLSEESCRFVRDACRESPERPFFLYLSLTSPHTPIVPTREFLGRTDVGPYGDFVMQTDHVVGRLMEVLQDCGIAERTLVVFTSDNGSPARSGIGTEGAIGSVIGKFGHRPAGDWRGLKGDAWEGGHRVPMIVRWPDRIAASRTSRRMTVLTDLYRTFARLAGVPVPSEAGEDSFDQCPEWVTATRTGPTRDTMVHHSQVGVFAFRRGPMKLILGTGSGGYSRDPVAVTGIDGQLYDLERDPRERVNLWVHAIDVRESLSAELQAQRDADRSWFGATTAESGSASVGVAPRPPR